MYQAMLLFWWIVRMSRLEQFTEKTQVIVTFALCSLANLSSVAILLGDWEVLPRKGAPK
jgi:nucleoside permease NupC